MDFRPMNTKEEAFFICKLDRLFRLLNQTLNLEIRLGIKNIDDTQGPIDDLKKYFYDEIKKTASELSEVAD